MRGKALAGLGLDRVIHERARLVILSYLAASGEREVAFTELRDELGMTAGNLSIQLKVLTDAGFVSIDKRYKDRRPFTGATLTTEGSLALSAYLREIEDLIGSVREGLGTPSENGATFKGGENGDA
ncbi:MAG: transcriptional regulator [Treponema sp.]|nr:transcriptional regulator [Treponema sp.]